MAIHSSIFAWRIPWTEATVHGVAKNQTPLSNQAHTCMKPQTLNLYSISIERKPLGFPGGSDSKASAYSVGDLGSIPGSGRSSGEGNGNPLQYSCLENLMDGKAWWAIVRGLKRVGHDGVTEPNRSMVLPKEYSRVGENHWN